MLAGGAALWTFRSGYGELRRTWSWFAVSAGVAVFVMWIGLEPPLPDLGRRADLRAGLEAMPALAAGAWLMFRVIGAVVAVPLAEELAFRGYVCRRAVSAEVASVPFG